MNPDLVYQVKPAELETAEPFSTLFPINKVTVEAITENMKAHGYDASEPIVVWNGIVIDGHTRLMAAKRARITRIPCVYRDFKNEDEAFEYAISRQRDRRNLTDADFIRLVGELDKRKREGRPSKEETTPDGVVLDEPARSSFKTAKILGISPRKVERIRTVLDRAEPTVQAEVLAGKKTVNAAYEETVKPKVTELVEGEGTPRTFRFKCSITAEVEAETEDGAVMAFIDLLNSYSEQKLSKSTKVLKVA